MTDPELVVPTNELAPGAADGTPDQQEPPNLVTKVTHEIDNNDMFVQGGE